MTKNINATEKGFKASAGTIIWWSVSGIIPVEKINEEMEKRGLIPFAKMPSDKHAFHSAWRRFGAARHDNYIPRLVFKKRIDGAYREVVGLIHEQHETDGESLKHGQYGSMIFTHTGKRTDNGELSYRCKCGANYTVGNIPNDCERCSSSVPSLAHKISGRYVDLTNGLDSSERSGQIMGFIEALGVISLSGTGRPFYTPEEIDVDGGTPEDKKGQTELFIDAIKAWGDTAHCLPLRADGIVEVQEFSFLSIKGELDNMNKEISEWGDTTRASTKAKRLEKLFSLNDKIAMYSRVLGSSKTTLCEISQGIESRVNEELNLNK